MTEISLWKRVGGWFRRSRRGYANGAVVQLDSEGLLVDDDQPQSKNNGKGDQDTAALSNNNDQQPTQMEQGFNRLVEVLQSINGNVLAQREISTELKTLLEGSANLAKTLPETIQSQQNHLTEIAEQFRNQSIQQLQAVENLRDLPELTKNQIDKLEDIRSQLDLAGQTESRIADSFQRLDTTMNDVAKSSGAQQDSLAQMNELLKQNNQQLQHQIARQNRRFAWSLALVTGALLLAAAAIVAVILWQKTAVAPTVT